MKNRSIFAVAAIFLALLVAGPAFAQDKKEKKEIIIRNKGDKNEKTVIVIEGDKVTVNGKPVDETNKQVIIEGFSDKDGDMIIHMPKSPLIGLKPKLNYRFDSNGDWKDFEKDKFMQEFKHEMKNNAFLGVVTDANEKGAEVKEVQKETAAEKAGLKKGDIITRVNDKNIKGPEDLVQEIRNKKPNDEVEITYLQNGKEKKVKVKLGETKMPAEMKHFEFKIPEIPGIEHKEFQFKYMNPGNEDLFREHEGMFMKRPKLGATIQDTEEGTAVKVLDIENNSPAANSGLQKEDLITEINGKKVNNVNEARSLMQEKTDNNTWSLKVLRGGKTMNIEVKIPKILKKADL